MSSITTVRVPARWASANAADLRTLVHSTDAVFAGRVARLAGQRDEPLLPSASAAAGGRSFPVSVFDVTVTRPIQGDVAGGMTVNIEQAGGISQRPDGSSVRFVLESDELLEPGLEYVFFANRRPDGSLTVAPFARLQVTPDGLLAPLPAWSSLGALQQLTNNGLEQAVQEVEAAGAP